MCSCHYVFAASHPERGITVCHCVQVPCIKQLQGMHAVAFCTNTAGSAGLLGTHGWVLWCRFMLSCRMVKASCM
jgi:hypothetical protein